MKYWKKGLCLACSCLLVMPGCSSAKAAVTDSSEAAEETTVSEAAESEAAIRLRELGTGTKASRKEEMVSASAAADGAVYEVTVQTKLIMDEDENTEAVADYSDLKDLKNTEGGEEFIELSQGEYLWEYQGTAIQYEGSSDKELPVEVEISYELDGKKIEPEELAGKSGHVKIRVDYENNETRTIDVEGTKVDTVVPFTAVTAILLDEEKFSDITVTNGEVSGLSGLQMVIGYAMPGVEEDSFEIPGYLELEAEVENFELDFTVTLITPGLLSDVSLDSFKDLENALSGMTDLGEASDEINDGFGELSDGVGTLSSNFDKFNDGISELQSGTETIRSGMQQILSAGSQLESGTAGITQGLQALEAALSSADSSAMPDLSGLQSMTAILQAVGSDVTNLMTAAGQMQAALTGLEEYKVSVEAYVSAVRGEAEAALGALNAMDTSEMTDEQLQALEEGKAQLAMILAEALPAAPEYTVDTELMAAASADLMQQMQALQEAAEGLGTALAGLGDFSAQLGELKSGISTLSSYASELTSGMTSYNSALNQLYTEGILALADGTGTLASAGNAFADGLKELTDAVQEFADGYKEFDEEGLQKLADLGDSDAELLLRRIRALKKADADYDNFGGKYEGQESSVTFLIETDSIE